MPVYDCGDPECSECRRAFGLDRRKAIANFEARKSAYAAFEKTREGSMTIQHAPDCAVHNMPEYPNGPCNSGAENQKLREALTTARAVIKEATAVLGGDWGDHYGYLMEKLFELDRQIDALTTPTQPPPESTAPASSPVPEVTGA